MHSNRIRQKVKKDYESIGSEFSETRKSSWKEFTFFEPFLTANLSILDLGAGNGRLLTFLKKYRVGRYLGVEQSGSLIEAAREKYPKAEFIEDDMIEFKSKEKFDALFAIASFHHVPPALQEETLKTWKKNLKKGGYLFITNWNLQQRKYLPQFFLSIFLPKYGFKGTLIPWKNKLSRYYFSFTKKRLNKLLVKAGYKVLFNEYVNQDSITSVMNARNIVTIAQYEKL